MGMILRIKSSILLFLPVVSLTVLFFFSSRRRHTRCLSDWSSDVCSSDLAKPPGRDAAPGFLLRGREPRQRGDLGGLSREERDQPAAVGNGRRPGFPVSGLLFTGHGATVACERCRSAAASRGRAERVLSVSVTRRSFSRRSRSAAYRRARPRSYSPP